VGGKHQTPSTKSKINPNDQNSKSQTKSFWSLDIVILNLFEIWHLGFEI
jgi:hypothetical protein